jgi:hypothetical protein
LNGTLTCFDFVGTRGDIPPPGIQHPAGTAEGASKGRHDSVAPNTSAGLMTRDEANTTITVGYSKTCYYITVTKSGTSRPSHVWFEVDRVLLLTVCGTDPVLIALCRETPSVDSPLLWNSLDLNSVGYFTPLPLKSRMSVNLCANSVLPIVGRKLLLEPGLTRTDAVIVSWTDPDCSALATLSRTRPWCTLSSTLTSISPTLTATCVAQARVYVPRLALIRRLRYNSSSRLRRAVQAILTAADPIIPRAAMADQLSHQLCIARWRRYGPR